MGRGQLNLMMSLYAVFYAEIFMLNFYAGSDKEGGLMSALFFAAPARQSEACSRREASPLGHEQAPAGCKNTKHEVRGIRGAKIGQMDSTCSLSR